MMPDNENGASPSPGDDTEDKSQPAPDAGREPEFVPSLPGRMISLKGLVERILQQFYAEHGRGESAAFLAADTTQKRRSLLRDSAEYVFGVESVQLSPKEKARIIARAYSELFSYGPLDDLLRDESVTTIALEGTEKVAVRHGTGAEFQRLDPIFDSIHHMRQLIERLLRDAGAELRPDVPIVETGLLVDDRRISISVASPPFAPELAADIRLHPRTMPTLEMLIQDDFMNEAAARMLKAIAQSPHGFAIVGDTESGKTTLLSAMLPYVSQPAETVTVERAGELVLPEGMTRRVVQWPFHNEPGLTFGEQLDAVLEGNHTCIVIDELRADEPKSLAPLLREANAPRQIWSFRGASDVARIRSSMGMLARMSDSTQPERMVFNLYERLPFLIVVKRRRGYLQLHEIAEWQFPEGYKEMDDFVYADYVPLMTVQDGTFTATDKTHKKALHLPDSL